MSQISAYVLIIFLAFGGFLIALYIRHHKKNIQEALICPLKANCDTVIHSDYSKFLGIPVEILGTIYYIFIAVGYGLIVIFPTLGLPLIASGLMFATVCAFTFSIYLTLIQAFILKNWCTWCLISAVICVAIFAIDASTSPLFSALFSNFYISL
ncbi:MAG: vitamin K epoxide reductase family protein [Candidatus Taylorbacteria bacterium]|nr:vitamin K epoxide reductase family protein [Candidatus Taylorbacteria bacterium]